MNFLAHCYLSCSDEELLVGNFIADFLKGNDLAVYPQRIQEGVQLHRAIDRFTDDHALSVKLRELIRHSQGKYASVAVDLVWDYYLSQNWSLYSGASLQDFADQTYLALGKYKDVFPGKLKSMYSNMLENNFLLAYANRERMESSLRWMDKRTRFPSNFISVVKDIDAHYDLCNEWFLEFFQDMIVFVEESCPC